MLKIKRTGRTWSIVNRYGEVVEGGFFARSAAEARLADWHEGNEHDDKLELEFYATAEAAVSLGCQAQTPEQHEQAARAFEQAAEIASRLGWVAAAQQIRTNVNQHRALAQAGAK